jgi:organic hydroperoxide reductase OsmC/OhrA
MGGSGGPGTNPGELFAVGDAVCFQSALWSVATGRKLGVLQPTRAKLAFGIIRADGST